MPVARRIVLYGASGHIGRAAAQELVAARARPVLAGRSHQTLAALGVRLGHGLDIAVADARDAESVQTILRHGDVVVSTVGPYARHGEAVVEAALGAGATYLDCAADAGFLRRLSVDFEPLATFADVAVIPGLGFRYVAGSLAAELALAGLHDVAHRVDITYVTRGDSPLAPAAGGLEPLTLPRRHPGLATVDVQAGGSRAGRAVSQIAARPRVPTGKAPATVTAAVFAADGQRLRAVQARGTDVEALTARLLAWAAVRIATGDPVAAGMLGPVEAFGLRPLHDACVAAGLAVLDI